MLTRRATTIALLSALGRTAVTRAAASEPASKLDRQNLKMVFSDEFEQPPSLWTRQAKQGTWKTNYFYADQFGASSRVTPQTTDIVVDRAYCGIDPFTQKDGAVHIELAKADRPDPKLAGKRYTSGLMSAERSFRQRYGYFEARLASPSAPGLWPAFWLYDSPVADLTGKQWNNGLGTGREWTGGLNNEIDIVEILTNNTLQTHHTASVRGAWLDGKPGNGTVPGFTPYTTHNGPVVVKSTGTDALHVYGALWNAQDIIWYVDDQEVCRAKNPGIHGEMYPILSMGQGGWDGNDRSIPADFTSASMIVDYVRIYEIRNA